MAVEAPGSGVRSALYELQRYLSDEAAPLMMMDSVEVLMSEPPSVVATAIQAWVSAQYGSGASLPVSDYIFHSLKKIHMMAELELVEPERVKAYLEELGRILVAFCPEADREVLRANLKGLGAMEGAPTTRADIVYRQVRADAPSQTVASAAMGSAGAHVADTTTIPRSSRLLIDRLVHDGQTAGAPQDRGEHRDELLTKVLADAAIESRTGSELEEQLR